MAANLFWSNVNTDPKRNFRFTLNIGNIPVWTVKSVNKPKANVAMIEHSFINHVFKYPGRVTWDNLSITLVDPMIDAQGVPIETWALKNPWIVSIDFGGTLDYTSDDMSNIAVEIAYDWAEITKHGNLAT